MFKRDADGFAYGGGIGESEAYMPKLFGFLHELFGQHYVNFVHVAHDIVRCGLHGFIQKDGMPRFIATYEGEEIALAVRMVQFYKEVLYCWLNGFSNGYRVGFCFWCPEFGCASVAVFLFFAAPAYAWTVGALFQAHELRAFKVWGNKGY